MANITVRGIELDYNPANARHIELLANAKDKMAKSYEKIKDVDPNTMSLKEYAGWLRKAAKAVLTVIDDVFGEGTVDKMNIDHDAFDECFQAFSELESEIERVSKDGDFVKYMTGKYAPIMNDE